MKQAHLLSKISLLAFAVFVFLTTGFSKQRPNIVFIVVDDMGFSDIGCYGGAPISEWQVSNIRQKEETEIY